MSKPITREEQFLAAMAGEGTAPKPLTRKEQFMAKSAGQTETAPTPLTRKEGFMDDISVGGSTPTGTINITENGTNIDVSEYAKADVNVSGGSSLGVFKVAQNVTGYDHTSATLNVWYAHDTGMTWREFVDSEYNPVYFFERNVETHEVYYSHLFTIDGNTVKMGTYYGQNLNELQAIVGATPDGVIDDTANYTATFDFTEGSN